RRVLFRSHWTTLAPPTGQNWTFVNTVTFEPFDRFSKMRYHWIPWIKTNSTHPVASISGYIDFPLFPVLSKTFERHQLLQFLSNPIWSLFLKFGTLIKDSPFFTHTKFHVSHQTTLAPPTGQSWTFVNTVTFEPFDRFSKMRYHC